MTERRSDGSVGGGSVGVNAEDNNRTKSVRPFP